MSKNDINNTINGASPHEYDWPKLDMSILRSCRSLPPQFPVEVLSPPLRQWLQDSSASTGAPIDYVFGGLLSVTSALIGNARRVSPWGDWQEPSALWIGLIGDPSSGKSPALNPIQSIITMLEKEMGKNFKAVYKEYETKRDHAECADEHWKKGVKKATAEGSLPPPKPKEAEAPIEPICPRVLCNDSTIEKIALLQQGLPKGLLLYRDELSGLFGGFDRYSAAKGVDRSFYLESYNGPSFKVDRVKYKETIEINHLLNSILGGIQPDKLASFLSGADDGFSSRFLWIWPEPLPPSRPSCVVDNTIILRAMRKLSLLTLTPDGQPHIIPLSSEAANLFEVWRREHYTRAQNTFGALKSFYGKNDGHFLRLALLQELLWWVIEDSTEEPKEVSAKAVTAAAHLIETYFKPMAERVYSDISIPEGERLGSFLARYIYHNPCKEINVRELHRTSKIPDLRKPEKANMAIQTLIEAGWLLSTENQTGGRPRKDYVVNPKVWESSDE